MYGNPFSEVLSSGAFLPTGREDILKEIAQVITLPKADNRDLHGLPGMGKTDILHYISEPQFIELYQGSFLAPYDKQPYRLFIVFIAGWIESIHPFVLLYREIIQAYRAYRDRVAGDHPELDLPDMDREEIDDLDGGAAMSLIEPLLRGLSMAGVRVAVLLDDFDTDMAYGALDADETSRLSSWKDYCSFILSTERRLEDVNSKAKGSPFYKRLTQTRVRNFLPQVAREFVGAILDKKDASLPSQDIERLCELAGGFPYLIFLAGRALWDMRQRTGLGDSPADPLPAVLETYLEQRLSADFRRMFDLYYEGRTEEERELLLDLALKGSLLLSEVEEAQSSRLEALEQYDLVELDGKGRATLFSPLFRSYLAPPASPQAELTLTGLQTKLYNVLRSRPGELLTFEELGEKVWAWTRDQQRELDKRDVRRIHLAASKLRGALEASGTGEEIVNVRDRGYRLEPAQ